MIAAALLLLAMQVTPELRQHVEAGLKAKAAGQLEVAVREFRRVAELAPNLPAAHVNLGAAYLETKDYASAVVSLRKALELDGSLVGAHGMLGAALLSQGYAAEAVPHLEKARAEELLSVALLECNRSREALEHLEAALLKRPGDPDLLYYLGEAHGRLAREAFERLRETSPESPRTRQMLGAASAATGNRVAAEQHFRAALQARADLRGVHLALGDLYFQAGDYEKAEAEFRTETKQSPGSAEAAYKLGSALLSRGHLPDAIAELKRADTLKPDMPETLVDLGRALNSAGDPASAVKYLEQAIRVEASGKLAATANLQLAQAYRKLGRAADAEQAMKRFRDLEAAGKSR
jgi:tetratricopeptide (TPR) repeat protein